MRIDNKHDQYQPIIDYKMAITLNVRYLLLLILFFISFPSSAAVYKCQDAQGNTVYQQTPCAAQEGKRVLILKSPTVPPREAEPQGLEQIVPGQESRPSPSTREETTPPEARATDSDRPIVYLPQPRNNCDSQRGQANFSYVLCMRTYEERKQLWQARFKAAEASGAHVIDAPNPNRNRSNARPIPTADGRWLYPNDPDGNTYHGSDGGFYIRQGSQFFNPATGERLQQ